MTGSTRIHERPAPEALAETVAHDLCTLLAARTNAAEEVHVVLTGGTVAALVHARTARLLTHRSTEIHWPALHLWWGDERWIPSASGERNDTAAHEQWVASLPVPAAQVHRFPEPLDQAAAEDDVALQEAAQSFAESTAALLPARFDLVMLGAGPDGHVASLFPDHDVVEINADVVVVEDSPKPPPRRLSLSLERLVRTDQLWIMATGEPKAAAVRDAAERGALPLGAVTSGAAQQGADVHWYLDTAAASLLSE